MTDTRGGAYAARRGDDGATAVEYSLMLAAVALAIIVAAYAIGPALVAVFQDVIGGLPS